MNARNHYPAGQKFEAIIRGVSGNEILRDVPTQEWMRKLRDGGTVESMAFVLSDAQKGSIAVNDKIEIISAHETS